MNGTHLQVAKGDSMQHLHPFELSRDKYKKTEQLSKLNPNAQTFRHRRDVAVAAKERIQEEWNWNSRKFDFYIH